MGAAALSVIDGLAVPSIKILGGCINVACIVHSSATRFAAARRLAGSDGHVN
jgi:hypothetical protein